MNTKARTGSEASYPPREPAATIDDCSPSSVAGVDKPWDTRAAAVPDTHCDSPVTTAIGAHPQRAGAPFRAVAQASRDRPPSALSKTLASCLGHAPRWLREAVETACSGSMHDALTGLLSRTALERRLVEMAAELPADASIAVLVMDIYRFHRINQTLGRQAGDAALVELARRLRGFDDCELLARVGADSFAVVLRDRAAVDWRGGVERMIKMLREPVTLAPGRARKLSASVGCALYPHDTHSASSVLGLAEAAVFSRAERELTRLSERIDPYGADAADKMAWLQRFIGPHLRRLNDDFVARLCARKPMARAAASELPAQAAVQLAPCLGHYVELLLAPRLEQCVHREQAALLGRLLAALGLPAQVGMHAMSGLYQSVACMAQRLPARVSERMLYFGTLLRRMEADITYQHEGAEQLRLELLQTLRESTPAMQAARRRADLLDSVVQALQRLPFMASCAVYTQDALGDFVLEAHDPGHPSWLRSPGRPTRAGDDDASEDALERCWLSSTMERAPDVARSARRGREWARRLLEADIRSAVAVPVVDGAGHVLLVLKLYGRLPGQFSTPLMRHALDSLCLLIATELQRVGEELALPAVAADERTLWRQRLFGGGLCMLVQPIVDLRQGLCTRVEALARLRLDERTLLSPARFLPILGRQELDRLFLEGLRLSLLALKAWEREGVYMDLTLNLPPSSLRNVDCVTWVRSALSRQQIDPRRLCLEILEDPDVASHATMRQSTQRLRDIGVRLALDDLGAGYSSLLRLNSLPIDMVKVDQGLVYGIVSSNPRAVPLVTGLVDLARRLELDITVEGLETQILLEYAQYLQADYGQGHAISRPMPAQQLPAWLRDWSLPPLSGITPFASMSATASRRAASR